MQIRRLIFVSSLVYLSLACSYSEVVDDEVSLEFEDVVESKKERSLRGAIEGNLRSLGIGAVYYWGIGDFEGDYDYPGTFDTFWKKMDGGSYIVDDNIALVNYGHALAGSEYYIIGRNHGLSMNESFWLSFGSSFVWEWLIEYRESFSINDQVLTPIGGLSIGEFRYQMYQYLIQSPRDSSFVKKSLAGLVNPDEVLNDMNSYFFHWDEGGGAFEMIPDFRYSLVHDDLDESHLEFLFSFHHSTLKESKRFKHLDMPYYASLLAEMSASDNAKEDLRLLTEVILWGMYRKSVSGFNRDRVKSTILGIASSFEYSKVNYELREHWHATTHILGLFAEQNFETGGWKVKGNVVVYGNMSLLEPYALVPFQDQRTRWFWQTESWNGGYVHTIGYSVHPSLLISKGPYEFKAEYDYHNFDILRGLDRDPDFVVNPLDANEWIQEFRFSLGRSFTLNAKSDTLFIGVTHRINDVSSSLSDKQWGRSSNRLGGSIRVDGHRSTSGVEVELRF